MMHKAVASAGSERLAAVSLAEPEWQCWNEAIQKMTLHFKTVTFIVCQCTAASTPILHKMSHNGVLFSQQQALDITETCSY